MDEWSTDASEGAYSTERWESYSDLMAVMLMVFALVLSAIMLVSALESQENAEQQAILDEQQAKLHEMKQLAAKRMGVHKEIIETLRAELAVNEVKVDSSTGAMEIGAAVLFAQGDATVTENGQAHLRKVLPLYTNVLLGPEFEKDLSRIIVEGHTNSDGPDENEYLYNLELSQNRALNVMKFIVDFYAGTPREATLKKYMVASGRSSTDRLMRDGREDREASRRIKLKFTLKDREMFKEVQQILHGQQ